MYYITNHDHQIIAASEMLLKSLQIQTIDELLKKVLLEEVSFVTLPSQEVQIQTSNQTYTYTTHVQNLKSMLGDLYLVYLEEELEKNSSLDTKTNDTLAENSLIKEVIQEAKEETKKESFSLVESENNTLERDKSSDIEYAIDDTSHEESSIILEEPSDLALSNEALSIEEENIDISQSTSTQDEELFDLTLPETPDSSIDDIPLDEVSKTSLDESPIIIQIDEVSENIGISKEDYKTFLNDYIDTAISLEDALKSDNEETRLSAMDTLMQLADVLQLPQVNDIIRKIPSVFDDERSSLVDSFYQTLARLTTKEKNKESISLEKESALEAAAPLHIDEDEKSDTLPTDSKPQKGFGKIYLEDVKPIHFDFQLEEAANDLSLPVELIEEFVHDFIEQAHTETKKMLQAYEEGDLETIQKIGHLLKGASSNLRINALSDTLYDIQFCQDSSKLEALIERYWAHFISFEQHIKMITKQ